MLRRAGSTGGSEEEEEEKEKGKGKENENENETQQQLVQCTRHNARNVYLTQDVWVDVGNKALGIKALQSLVGSSGANTVHFGDRFTRTGNDVKARHVASTIWVENPQDTEALCQLLLRDISDRKTRELSGSVDS